MARRKRTIEELKEQLEKTRALASQLNPVPEGTDFETKMRILKGVTSGLTGAMSADCQLDQIVRANGRKRRKNRS